MDFIIGKLYFRTVNGALTTLFFPDAEVPANYVHFHRVDIGSFSLEGSGRLLFGGSYETSQQGEMAGSGQIGFKEATDDDIRLLLKSNDGQNTVDAWLKNVLHYGKLDQAEKARVIDIAHEFIGR